MVKVIARMAQRAQELCSEWREMLGGRQRGQSLVLLIFMFVGILAFVGLGIDLGWVYVERVRVAQAADASALAGASELPLEGAAHARALAYLQENGYDYTGSSASVVVDGSQVSGPPVDEADTVIWIDTSYSRDTSLPPNQQANTADRIRVRVRQQVFMTFMQFVGFRNFPVEASAEAENISNIDTVLVFDRSGSMEFDTICYGCWERSGEEYPGGDIYPLLWSNHTIVSADHCAGWDPSGGYNCGGYQRYLSTSYDVNNCNYRHRTYTDRYYVVVEAEEYSRLSADYHNWGYTPYYTFWAVQRNGKGAYYERDTRGTYLSHHPYAEYRSTSGLGVACTWNDLINGRYCRRGLPAGGPYAAPRADYDFYAPSSDTYYIWIRGQGGNQGGNRHIFWGMGGTPMGQEDGFPRGPYYDGASAGSWDWRCLGDTYLHQGAQTLNLWAGGAGFDVDRIVITTDDSGNRCYYDSSPPGSPDDYPPNNGRTDWACSSCDPRFAGRPGGHEWTPAEPYYRPDCSVGGSPDQRNDDIYDDEQPIRTALEAAKHFISRMNPRFDQVGYVRYSSNAEIASELQCVRRLGTEDCTAQVITDTVLYELERTTAGGSTNIAYGMHLGIEVLSTVGNHYGRPGAAHVMILMTDGEANKRSGCDAACDDEDLWPDGSADKDCVVYYARKARDNAIVIYTISLGWSADRELMEYTAELTGGYHRWAPTPDKLDEIFDELYQRIFLRLIG